MSAVAPDTLTMRNTQRVDEVGSMGSLFRGIQTSALLCSTILASDANEINSIRKGFH